MRFTITIDIAEGPIEQRRSELAALARAIRTELEDGYWLTRAGKLYSPLVGNGYSFAEIKPRHNRDSDCTVDPETNLCTVCLVGHGDPCHCGGRGYHVDGCREIEP